MCTNNPSSEKTEKRIPRACSPAIVEKLVVLAISIFNEKHWLHNNVKKHKEDKTADLFFWPLCTGVHTHTKTRNNK